MKTITCDFVTGINFTDIRLISLLISDTDSRLNSNKVSVFWKSLIQTHCEPGLSVMSGCKSSEKSRFDIEDGHLMFGCSTVDVYGSETKKDGIRWEMDATLHQKV